MQDWQEEILEREGFNNNKNRTNDSDKRSSIIY